MNEPSFGDRVFVRARHSRVQEFAAIPGRFLSTEWVEHEYCDWLHRRYMTGEIELDIHGEAQQPLPEAPKASAFLSSFHKDGE